jgi:hypothetical protein
MAGLFDPVRVPDLIPVAPEALQGGHGGDAPLPVYTCAIDIEGARRQSPGALGTYSPSGGGAPRLVVGIPSVDGDFLGVYDTGTGAFLRALQASRREPRLHRMVTYQRPLDGRPGVAAADDGRVCVWNGDGDDPHALHTLPVKDDDGGWLALIVYEEPTSSRTRLVSSG